jgi:hypothetical protein
VSSDAPPTSAPFGPRLTSPVPSSSCRTHRRPPRPPELHRHLGTPPHRAIFSASPPPGVSGENPAAPSCPTQPPSLPCGVPIGRATPRPLVKPRSRVCGHRAVTSPSACVAPAGVGRLGQANSAGPWAEMSDQHSLAIF